MWIRVKGESKLKFPDHIEKADYNSLVALPGVEWRGSFFFCLGPDRELMEAPVNFDGTVSLSEAHPVEIWAVEETEKAKIREIAEKLRCRLL